MLGLYLNSHVAVVLIWRVHMVHAEFSKGPRALVTQEKHEPALWARVEAAMRGAAPAATRGCFDGTRVGSPRA